MENLFFRLITKDKFTKISDQLVRLNLTKNDLDESKKYIEILLRSFNNSTDVTVLESLSVSAVVSYTRCFNSDYSLPIPVDIFDNTVPDPADPANLSMREFHKLVMNWRNQHIVHSNKLMNIGGIGGNKNESGSHEIMILNVGRSKVEDQYFYQSILKLIEESQKYVNTKINEKSEIIKKALDNNEIELDTTELKFTPIPSDKSPRELWGL